MSKLKRIIFSLSSNHQFHLRIREIMGDVIRRSEFLVAFCYNKRPESFHYETDTLFAEYDPLDTIKAISDSIKELGFPIEWIEYDENFVENLKKIKPNLVFNIAEGFRGEEREAQAPAIMEALGIPYTGSGPLAKSIALNKITAKKLMEYHNVKTSPFMQYSMPITQFSANHLKFPIIVKPMHEGSSIGIDNNAVVENSEQLISRVNYIIQRYKQPALIEQYIEGREFTQAILGNEELLLFPIVETDFSGLPPGIRNFSSFEVKYVYDTPTTTVCPANISQEEKEHIQDMASRAYRALGMKDYARVDMRMDHEGNVYVLEVNASPGLAPGILENCSYPKSIKSFGWTYPQLIEAIINCALDRYHIRVTPLEKRTKKNIKMQKSLGSQIKIASFENHQTGPSLSDQDFSVRTLSSHSTTVWSVAISPDGKYILSGSYDNTVKVWDRVSGSLILDFTGHTASITSVIFTPDGKYAISGSYDKTIKIWDPQTGQVIRTLTGHSLAVTSLAISSNGRYLVSGSIDMTVKIWDMNSFEIISSTHELQYPVYTVTITPDNQYTVSGSLDGSIKIHMIAPKSERLGENPSNL